MYVIVVVSILVRIGVISSGMKQMTTNSDWLRGPDSAICYDMEAIGRMIRLRRKELGYTQVQVAEFLGYSPRLVGEIERGRATVAIGKVMRYANGLGIDFILRVRGKG